MNKPNQWTASEEEATAYTALISALRSSPGYQRAMEQARDLDDVESRIRTADDTGYSSYMRLAREEITKFRTKWITP